MLGKKLLTTFYDSVSQQPFHPKYIEQFFKLRLKSYTFVGKIDRADARASGIAIFDYKTGKQPKKNDKKDLDQLHIYQWAAQEFLKETVVGLTYWFLQDNAFVEEPVAAADKISALKENLLTRIERIVYVTQYDLFKEEHKKSRDHNCEFEHLE